MKSLCSYLVTDLGLDLRDPTTVDIAADVVSYITDAIDAYAIQHSLKLSVNFNELEYSAQTFRLHLMETSYISMNVKYFCLCLALNPITVESISRFAGDFKIARNDVVLLKKVFELKNFRRDLRSSKRLSALRKEDVDINALNNIYKLFDDIYPNVMRHIKGMTYKKLRFVTFSNNIMRTDFHCDLLCKAITTFNKLMPCTRSAEYVQNYVKRAVTNHTQNLISKYTTQKRGRMLKGKADGFGGNEFPLLVVSQNQVGATGLSFADITSAEATNDERESQLTILNFRSILRLGRTKRHQMFIRLVSGVEHKGFTDFLIKKSAIRSNEDNLDLYNRVSFNTYLGKVCEYLSVDKKRGLEYLIHIGKKAYPEKSEKHHVA